MPRLKDLAVSVKDSFQISLDKLVPGKNFRRDFSTVPDLAISMFNFGQLTPLIVRLKDGKFAEICSGERRFKAAQYVNKYFDEWSKDHDGGFRFDSLSCVAEPQNVDPASRILRRLEQDGQAEPLKPLELAAAYKALVEGGMTMADIAKRIGKTAQYVANYLSMLEAPEELKKAVEKGTMSPTAAVQAVKGSPEKRQKAVEKAQRGEKVKVKDVASYHPLGLEEARKAAKKARGYAEVGASQVERARWEGLAQGVEIGVGLRPLEF